MASILIVDDDPTIRAMFHRALQSLGDIEIAANGADALRLLSTRRYDVVLLDLRMPVVDGFEVLDTLANKPGPNRETPVYVVSADLSDNARVRALRKHAVFFLTKPVPLVALVGLIKSSLEKAATRVQTPPKASAAVPNAAPDASGDRMAFLPGAPPEGAAARPVVEGRAAPPRPIAEPGGGRGSVVGAPPAPRAPNRTSSTGPEPPRRGSSPPGGGTRGS